MHTLNNGNKQTAAKQAIVKAFNPDKPHLKTTSVATLQKQKQPAKRTIVL